MMPGRRKLGLTAIITMTNNLRRGDDISISPPGCECDTLMREWPDGLLRLITVIVSPASWGGVTNKEHNVL